MITHQKLNKLEVCICPHALNEIKLVPNRVNELLKSLEVLLVWILAPVFSAVSHAATRRKK